MVSPHFPYNNYNMRYIECKVRIKKRDELSSPCLKAGASALNYFGDEIDDFRTFARKGNKAAYVMNVFLHDKISFPSYTISLSVDFRMPYGIWF